MSDLRNVKSMVVVFAMPGCHACHDYLPRFKKQLAGFQAAPYNVPFRYYEPGQPIDRGAIPVMILDATSQDPSIVEFANLHGVSGMPTTLILFNTGVRPIKYEGAIDDAELYHGLVAAAQATR